MGLIGINYDIAAIITCIMLWIALVVRQLTRGRSNGLFLFLVVQIIITSALDIVTELYGPVFAQNQYTIALQSFLNYLYFLVHNMTAPSYVLYITSVFGIWHKVQDSIKYKSLIFVPFGISILLIHVNIFNHKIYGFTEDGIYQRGPWIYFLYGIAAYYMVFALILVYRNREYISRFKLFILALYIPVSALGVFMQMVNYQWRMEMISSAIMTVVVALSVQRPEEYIDPVVNALSYGAFSIDMGKYFGSGRPMSVMMIKMTNQLELRHNLGIDLYSLVTKRLSGMISRICRIMGIFADVYYLDGGVMAVVADGDKYDLMRDAARLLVAYADEPVKLTSMEIKLDIKCVIAKIPEEYNDLTSFMEFTANFDELLPSNKKLILLEDHINTSSFRMRANLDAIISRSIAEHNLQMYYQPIYSIKDKKFRSAEALIRLIDSEYGFISPGIFIPAAEKSGAIHKIGDFVNNDVCRFISSVDFKGLGLEYIEINLSVAQCIDPGLIEGIRNAMDTHKVKCDQLNLEITETAVDYDPVITNNNLKGLANMGLKFSLDDYGTGYSNIARVATMPIEIVKIDKSMVDEIRNPMMWIVIENTVKMLKKLDKKILVEGVEDAYAFSRFEELECDYIQGYYFSKPLPETDFIRFIEERNL